MADCATLETMILGRSPAIESVRSQILDLVARPPRSVLVLGESGTGKELVPTAVARLSSGLGNTVEVFNCPAIPSDHLESELFGTTRGSYSGAIDRAGAAERARGGVLFLDEIGAMDLQHQAKILRLLETGEARRLGAQNSYRTDAMIAAATNESLLELTSTGSFREDLYYRLVQDAVIELPPLRERLEDIPVLAARFLAEFPARRHLLSSALRALASYDWPGNIRQLRAVVRSAARLARSEAIDDAEIVEAADRIGTPRSGASSGMVEFYAATPRERRRLLLDAHEQCEGNQTLAGLTLGLHRARYGTVSPPELGARKLAYRKFRYWWHRLRPDLYADDASDAVLARSAVGPSHAG